jgi:hypothetical protein
MVMKHQLSMPLQLQMQHQSHAVHVPRLWNLPQQPMQQSLMYLKLQTMLLWLRDLRVPAVPLSRLLTQRPHQPSSNLPRFHLPLS